MTAMPLEKSPRVRAAERVAALADQCVQCGLCLPACPTYALDRNEAESPRGRIALAAALARGQLDPAGAWRAPLDHCLGCLGCESVCPAQVRYGELLFETRALLGPPSERPRFLLGLLTRPARRRALRRVARWVGVPRWQPWLARRLPRGSAWRSALRVLPETAPAIAATSATSRGTGGTNRQLALFPGCVASVEDAQAQQDAVTLLQAAGFGVSVLPAFCCGAIDLHAGLARSADHAAAEVRQAWLASGAGRLVSITPGCLGTLRRALPAVEVLDPLQLLAAHADLLHFRPLARRVAVHLPCTQVNVARSESALLQLLRQVPGLDVQPLPRPQHCCGAAGSHLLEFPERAARLREPVLRQITTLEPQLLLSSNIGCRLHLAAGLADDGQACPTLHPLSLLARQLESAH